MDNRERYQKYRERSADPSGSSRQSSFTLTSKLKSIFKPWNKSESDVGSGSSNISGTSQPTKNNRPESIPLGTSTLNLPGSFYGHQQEASQAPPTESSQQLPVMHSSSIIVDKDEPIENPNDILSTFFKEKGNSKLTDVEYEGVMALMSKSRMGTPYKRPMTEMSFTNDEPSFKKRHLGNDSTMVGNVTSIIGSTPSRQKVIRMNGNTTLHAPGYTPKYSKVYNDTFDRSYSLINNTIRNSFGPTSRRVSSRSRRPAPYKSRINSSTLLKADGGETSVRNENNSSILRLANETANKSYSSKPPSKAAQTLLNILDGKDEVEGSEKDSQCQQNDKLKLFINPYGTGSERKSKKFSNSSSQTSGITAQTIGKTISFSKSEPLPKNFEPTAISAPGNNRDSKKEDTHDQQSTKANHFGEGASMTSNTKPNTSTNDSTISTKSSLFQVEQNPGKQPLFTFSQQSGTNIGSGVESQTDMRKGEVAKPKNSFGFKVDDSKSAVETTKPFSVHGISNGNNGQQSGSNTSKFNPIASTSKFGAPMEKQDKTFGAGDSSSTNFKGSHSDAKEEDSTTQLNGTSQAPTSEFDFPSPQLVAYEFDDAEVDKYKSVFSF
ncbi:hypothetical protein I9W82_003961 [Candida metapsilosis]|uniref:Nucleoporin NUP60 n=1 Tax=Candida metapsilosis TaxID=273372 RepID=A0A8H8D9Q3_9ASCO|nr:hypothetical protein I9W82_003961 [Candida metapsilosis]